MARRALLFTLAVLFCLCCPGCSFSGLDAQNLMAPPKSNADQQSIHQLLQGDKTELTLVYPKNGSTAPPSSCTTSPATASRTPWASTPKRTGAWWCSFW